MAEQNIPDDATVAVEVVETPTESMGERIAGLQQAARERLGVLLQRRTELAFDAVLNADARSALEAVETEIGETELELSRLRIAAAENERREIVRLNREDYERKRTALVEAHELGNKRTSIALALDVAADAFVDAAAAYNGICREMARLVRAGGQPNGAEVAMPDGGAIKRAFARAAYGRFDDLGGLYWFEQFSFVPAHQAERLADFDPLGTIGIEKYIERTDAAYEGTPPDAPREGLSD